MFCDVVCDILSQVTGMALCGIADHHLDIKSFLFCLEYLFPFDMLDLQYIQVEIKQKLLLNLNLSQISTIKLN